LLFVEFICSSDLPEEKGIITKLLAYMIKKAILFVICLLLNITIISKVQAEEITITVSGNGSDSSSQAQVQTQNTTSVSQSNNANVDNSTSSNLNTGANEANYNSGDSSILTGDAQNTTSVTNQNINTNSANASACCNLSSNTVISGNGTGSTNYVSSTNTTTALISQNNTANITNNIYINANTGYNNALYNGGSATIITGDITSNTTINNMNINNSFYKGAIGMGDSSILITENGAYSFNNAVVYDNFSVVVTNDNTANILNNVEQDLNTGGNNAWMNNGDVAILTGGIKSNVTINNENINSNFVEVECRCEKPQTPSQPNNPPAGSSILQGASGSSGSSGSSSSPGNTLPVTGSSIPFTLIATLLLFFMLLAGLYLRIQGAHAPPKN